MGNIMLRIIRPIENAAEKEYIKEFFRFIGCLISDCPVENHLSSNWDIALTPRNENDAIDVILNYMGNDPHLQTCQQMGIRRIYSYFDCHTKVAQVTVFPVTVLPAGQETKVEARQKIIRELINQIWEAEPETRGSIQNIAEIYMSTPERDLFYFLQSKRCLRVLSMGEVLKEPSAQVRSIPLHPYVLELLSALWEINSRLMKCTDAYSTYTRVNAASMIRETIYMIYDTDRPKLKAIKYQDTQFSLPSVDVLIKEMQRLLTDDPQFYSAYLLMANIYKITIAANDIEELCYKKMLDLVPSRSEAYAFVWYRCAYYYEKKLIDMDKALEHYQMAVKVNPRCYQALFKLGYYAAADGRYNEAESLLNRTIQVIFCGRSPEPDEKGMYGNWLTLSLKDSQYVFKAYILLARIAINRSQEYAAKAYIGRACMAVTNFDEATLIRHLSDEAQDSSDVNAFDKFMKYHQQSIPVWAMWKVLSPWSEDIIQDYFIRDVVRQHLERWPWRTR